MVRCGLQGTDQCPYRVPVLIRAPWYLEHFLIYTKRDIACFVTTSQHSCKRLQLSAHKRYPLDEKVLNEHKGSSVLVSLQCTKLHIYQMDGWMDRQMEKWKENFCRTRVVDCDSSNWLFGGQPARKISPVDWVVYSQQGVVCFCSSL